MSDQQNLLLVQEFYAAFKRGDITGVLSTLAVDVGWLIPGPKDIIAFVGQRQGQRAGRPVHRKNGGGAGRKTV